MVSEMSLAQRTAEAVARRSYGKLVAYLAAPSGNVAAAEDALADAFAAALAHWPRHGCPDNPEAWLLTAARRRLIDAARRRVTREAGQIELSRLAEVTFEDAQELPDRRLGLLFACAHPAIDPGIRAPLMLQAVLGFDANRIASAFLTSPAAMGQRLVRAKNKIRQAGIPLRIPEREDLPARLGNVLEAIYAAFAEGWVDAVGNDAVRRDLAEEAVYLGRLVVALLPDEAEASGLLALMLYAEARHGARRDARGEFVPLAEQDCALWDSGLIEEAEMLLLRAGALHRIGRYQLEAALQSAHIHRRRSGQSNWAEVVGLYDALLAATGSSVVAVNRALAVAELHGAGPALDALESVAGDKRLVEYQPFWATRARLLALNGAGAAARVAYDVAIGLSPDPAVRRYLQQLQATLAD